MASLFNNTVGVVETGAKDYPATAPYDPDQAYPELKQLPFPVGIDPANKVYGGVREALRLLGLDRERFGTPEWNPLGELVRPGQKAVVKPNFVLHCHRGGEAAHCLTVHASVLRPILDYLQIALKGEGEVLVADAPVTDADWDELVKVTGVGEMLDLLNRSYPLPVGLRDLRKMAVAGYEQSNIFLSRRELAYGKKRSVVVNLGRHSAFFGLPRKLEKLYYGADFDRRVPQAHHRGQIQEYSVAADILEADAVICVAKLKTHKSAGVTLSVKNIVGINTDKNFLPHYRIGEPRDGGDEYPDTPGSLLRWKGKLARAFLDLALGRFGRLCSRPLDRVLRGYRRKVLGGNCTASDRDTADLVYERLLGRKIRCGHWWGNDTLWRIGTDLNRVLLYAGQNGAIQETPQRTYLSLVDGIVGGEGKGPMVPRPRREGILLAGFSPVSTDRAAVVLMGFDESRIPVVFRVAQHLGLPLGPSQPPALRSGFGRAIPRIRPFEPAPNWKGHIELRGQGSGFRVQDDKLE